jgi:hypothetical protein
MGKERVKTTPLPTSPPKTAPMLTTPAKERVKTMPLPPRIAPMLTTTAKTTARTPVRTTATTTSALTSSFRRLKQPSRAALPDRSSRVVLVVSSRALDSATFSEVLLETTTPQPLMIKRRLMAKLRVF